MTSLYGVTARGAQGQIYDKLEKAGVADEHMRFRAAMHLSKIVLEGMKETCPSATAIMAWLAEVARCVVKTGNPIAWTTPLGLPVVQPYKNSRIVEIRTISQKILLSVPDESTPIAAGKHIKAFAPNYVHSIDATHMLMTAKACRDAGVTFAAVHDCYLTHAATVGPMSRILREQFIELHQRPLLDELRDQMQQQFKIDIPEPPPLGNLDINQVMNATYFFS